MKKMSGILWGIAITAVGVILALNAIGLTDINIFFHGWWTLFIIVPSFIGLVTDRNKTGSIIGLCIGVCLLLGCLGITQPLYGVEAARARCDSRDRCSPDNPCGNAG